MSTLPGRPGQALRGGHWERHRRTQAPCSTHFCLHYAVFEVLLHSGFSVGGNRWEEGLSVPSRVGCMLLPELVLPPAPLRGAPNIDSTTWGQGQSWDRWSPPSAGLSGLQPPSSPRHVARGHSDIMNQ